ncbi:hypothetical protein DYB38_007087 [Aphanomyces astaci]|uniref:SAM domain-containing protein n=1 Tax=Aphanomyces astaci TaxID=112090 RepID=A0A397DBB8_APHAT|nr:hypothetical protein DYB38_007087 [Aphanomyces astaci]
MSTGGTHPRLHVPNAMASISSSFQEYVNDIEPDSIADDLAHHRRIHHAVAHPSLDSHVLFLPSTSVSTVNSLLDDALKHLSSLTPADDVALEDKYHDIWADIEADRARTLRDLLSRTFRSWATTSKVRHAARRLGQHGHKRRVARCFRAWCRRSTQRHHVALKFALAMKAFQLRSFRAWAKHYSRSKLVHHKHSHARARHFKGMFLKWKTFSSRRRCAGKLAQKHHQATIDRCFHEWKATAAIRRQQRRAVLRLGHTLGSAQVGRRFVKWKQQVVASQMADVFRHRRHQRTRDLQCDIFRRWRRRARLVIVAGRRFDNVHNRQMGRCFHDWKTQWHQHRTLKPATWTCDTVGLWLAALFQLPPDAARACQATGHDLLSLPSRLSTMSMSQKSPPTNSVLEKLLPTLPLFFCSAEHRLQLVDGIASLSKTNATRLSKDILTQQRVAKLDNVHDFLGLRYAGPVKPVDRKGVNLVAGRHWCAQDRELIMYVRQLDSVGLHMFLQLEPDDLGPALKCHRPEHVALLLAGQRRLQFLQVRLSFISNFHFCVLHLYDHSIVTNQAAQPVSTPNVAQATDEFNLSTWLHAMHLSLYEPSFRQHGITSASQLSQLTPDILRHTLHIPSKLHRDRILQFAAGLYANRANQPPPTAKQGPAFRMQLALSHIDTTTSSPVKAKPTGSATLAKQVRTLLFSICRWLEAQTPPHRATLDSLYAAMQATSQGHITKTSFAHGLRAMNAGFTTFPRAKTDGRVGYESFVRFFVDVFNQRRMMLQLAVHTLGGDSGEVPRGGEAASQHLSQLLHALARTDDILARAGMNVR